MAPQKNMCDLSSTLKTGHGGAGGGGSMAGHLFGMLKPVATSESHASHAADGPWPSEVFVVCLITSGWRSIVII